MIQGVSASQNSNVYPPTQVRGHYIKIDSVAPVGGTISICANSDKLGHSSPVLQETKIRKSGHAPLPVPATFSAEELLNLQHDSTRVQVDVGLVNFTTRPDS